VPKTKRKRAPGAGRPRIDPRGSVIAQIRFTQKDWAAIESLVERRGTSAAQEVRGAVRFWLRLQEQPGNHVGALMLLASVLTQRIEALAGKRWNEDAIAGTAVAKGLKQIVEHFAPVTSERLPPVLDNAPNQIITMVETLNPGGNIPPEMYGENWVLLAQIISDLGMRNIERKRS
jgi:hypothetical protein